MDITTLLPQLEVVFIRPLSFAEVVWLKPSMTMLNPPVWTFHGDLYNSLNSRMSLIAQVEELLLLLGPVGVSRVPVLVGAQVSVGIQPSAKYRVVNSILRRL